MLAAREMSVKRQTKEKVLVALLFILGILFVPIFGRSIANLLSTDLFHAYFMIFCLWNSLIFLLAAKFYIRYLDEYSATLQAETEAMNRRAEAYAAETEQIERKTAEIERILVHQKRITEALNRTPVGQEIREVASVIQELVAIERIIAEGVTEEIRASTENYVHRVYALVLRGQGRPSRHDAS